MNPLRRLGQCGQSPWLDYLKRSLIASGELRSLIEQDGLRGITSNPSIFEAALGDAKEYGEALKRFQTRTDHPVSAIYEHLVIADIQAAADTLHSVYVETHGRDGYVSLECSPYLAHDTEATVAEAQRLWRAVDRPNLMIKVPATPAGIPAIRHLIGRGLNINVTLIFAIEVYEQVVDAYVRGIEDFAQAGGDVSTIASVASIFVSRIDVAIDQCLKRCPDQGEADGLRGKVAIANAKLIYLIYRIRFASPRWRFLATLGAQTQRLLWASTSTKNPADRDTLYVEALIGRDTVDTLPPATMNAFRDHGLVTADAIELDVADARRVLLALERQGIALTTVTDGLLDEGVRLFSASFDTLLGTIARRRRRLIEDTGHQPGLQIEWGSASLAAAVAAEHEEWRRTGGIRRLWAGDRTLWSGTDEAGWTGWLHVVRHEWRTINQLRAFAEAVRQGGFRDLVLIGMGGSSLGPEVLGLSFGHQPGWPALHILDSTDPTQIKAIEQAVDLTHTLFIVSSKSGKTLEPLILLDYFYARMQALVGHDRAGAHFVAVTDRGSPLQRRARAQHFRHVFFGVRAIGGRYAVLSKFGLVPAAALGLDVKRLLGSTRPMEISCGPDVPPAENPGVQLGVALGTAATRFGRNKVTIIASPGLAAFGAWLEQLLAESTGKQGRGLIPIADEPIAAPTAYGNDRFFLYLGLDDQPDSAQRAAIAALEQAGHPVTRIAVRHIWDIGQEFFRWEIATAVASAIIGVDPFNQPDVEASKDRTRALTRQYEESQTLPVEVPVFREKGLALYADPPNAAALGRHNALSGYLKSHFDRVDEGDYVALLAYLPRNDANTRALTAIRTGIRDRTHAATCLGYGPRFQHSTGQLYKGGPNTGVFLQVTCDDPADLAVPGHRYSFGIVKAAQARGDLDVLEQRGRRAIRLHLSDVDSGLADLQRAIESALPSEGPDRQAI